jgi:hypothetical protein
MSPVSETLRQLRRFMRTTTIRMIKAMKTR